MFLKFLTLITFFFFAIAQDTTQWRPSFHFSPIKNWINDPNGLFYQNGFYHIFFQFNPYGNEWGSMSWGHAISTDLFHWDELPVAILSQPTEDIFSGSIVIDTKNVTGLGIGNISPIIAIYTSAYKQGSSHGAGIQAQSLAYSLDTMAETFTFFPNNPVLNLNPEQNDFRDPKVFWYEKGGYWVMVTVIAENFTVRLWRSNNLLDWKKLSDFSIPHVPHDGAQWECPNLFPLPLDGDSNNIKWVMIVNVNPWSVAGGSGGMYYIGNFDGVTFTAQNFPPPGSDLADFNWLDHGADFYAASTFYNMPNPNEQILLGWMNNWDYAGSVPTSPWRGAFSIPRTMTLKAINGIPKLVFNPSIQFKTLIAEGETIYLRPITLSSNQQFLDDRTRGTIQNIDFNIQPLSAKCAGIIVRANEDGSLGTKIIFDIEHRTLTVDRSKSGKIDFSNKFSLQHTVKNMNFNPQDLFHIQIIVDRASVEVFAGDNTAPITDIIFPDEKEASKYFQETGVSDFWVGLSKLQSQGAWAWTDNTPFDYTDWKKGEPHNVTGNDCVAFSWSDGFWNTQNCFKLKPFVCAVANSLTSNTMPPKTTMKSTTTKRPATTTSHSSSGSCDDGWAYYAPTKSCYGGFVAEDLDWDAQEKHCQSLGAHMPSIRNIDELNFINNNYTLPLLHAVWLGYYSDDSGATWKWSDNTPFDFAAWGDGFPMAIQGRSCGSIDAYADGGDAWYENGPCNEIWYAICKKPST